MIPILYDKTETSFTSNGLGRLTDCLRCIVTEERNGVYECEFDYPISGDKYSLIQEGQIIAVTHDDNGDIQPFDIYHRTAPINGVVTFYARHISYRQIGITVEPFTASGVANAIAGIKTNSYDTNPFTYSTDKTTAGDYTVTVPSSAKALLGGEENSLLDVFGAGEYEFDKFSVKLWARRGTDTDVEIRYRKNLSDIEHDVDYSESYNGVVPYWYGMAPDPLDPDTQIETLVMLTEVAVMASGATYDGRNTILPLDLSTEFDEAPSENDLRTLATQKLNAADTLKPIENITVSFVQLWQTDEYANVAPLQKVGLCDTVSVIYPELGVDKATVKVIKTVYNTLLDRYDEMELGDSISSYASIITANNTSAISQLEDGLLIVSSAAAQAQSDADTAHDAAIIAQGAAGDAQAAADAAQRSADDANRNAGLAQTAADNAQRDATAAGKAANGALSSLSVVEDVLGVLNWVSEHGTYAATSDTEVVPGKFYFTRSGTAPNYTYTVVLNPTGDPSAQGYYELTGTDEAVSQYVSSHLALTNAGLYVINDNNSYKILLASDGMYVYDELGALVSKFGQSITFSDTRPQTIGNTTNYIKFYDSNTDGIADSIEIAGSNVNIASSVSIGGLPQSDYLNSELVDEKTATGSIVSITDASAYPALDVSTTIEAVQAGSGTPSPSNPRAISGFSSVKVSRTGKNLFTTANATTGKYLNSSGALLTDSGWNVSDYIPVPSYKTLYFNPNTTEGGAAKHIYYDANKEFISYIASGASQFTAPSNAAYMRFSYRATSTDIQLEIGGAATAYEAYQGDTYTIDLDGTRYGGTLDVTTGVLTVTHKCVDMGDIGWQGTPSNYVYATFSDKKYGVDNLICECFRTVNVASVSNMVNGDIKGNGGNNNIYVKDERFTRSSDFTNAVDGISLVYELATPITISLTAQEIEMLQGINNVWTNCGTTTLQYAVLNSDMLALAEQTGKSNKFITQIGSDGLKVHAEDNIDQNYAKIDADGMEVYKGGNSVAQYGDTARIGKANSFNTQVLPNGIALMNPDGVPAFGINASGFASETQTYEFSYKHEGGSDTKTARFTAPLNKVNVTFTATRYLGSLSNSATLTLTASNFTGGSTDPYGSNCEHWTITTTGSPYVYFDLYRYSDTEFSCWTSDSDDAYADFTTVSYTTTAVDVRLQNFSDSPILWEGGAYMNADQTAYLKDSVSSQLSGIVLVWSAYVSGAKDYDWHYTFVPKRVVALGKSSVISTGLMARAGMSAVGEKTVSVHNNRIVGDARNTASGTALGITYNNSSFVLRYVIGV